MHTNRWHICIPHTIYCFSYRYIYIYISNIIIIYIGKLNSTIAELLQHTQTNTFLWVTLIQRHLFKLEFSESFRITKKKIWWLHSADADINKKKKNGTTILVSPFLILYPPICSFFVLSINLLSVKSNALYHGCLLVFQASSWAMEAKRCL